MSGVERTPRTPADKIDAIRSAAPRALNGVGLEALSAASIRIVDVTDPENTTVVVTGGSDETITYFVRPDGLSTTGSGGEIFTLVTPEEE